MFRKSKLFILLATLAVSMLLVTGCGGGKENERSNPPADKQNAEMKVLKMGLIPAEDQEEMMKRFGSTIAYLEKKLGIKVEPFMATDYSGVIEAMRSKKVDVAFFGPFSYVLAADVANAEAFAVGVRSNGKSTYQSIIVAHKDSGIKTLNDLRGKDFVFVDPASTSGNLFPRVMLKKAGIDPEKDFKSVTYAGGHDAVELAIKNKKVPAGADNDITYEKMVKEGLISPEENIIIAKSDPIPGSPIVYRKDLPEDLKQKIKQAFLNMHNEDPQALSGYGEIIRYDEARDSDYNIIRETAKILNLDLKKMK
ncbi:phosphonate ABC transporter substrate-binding protein [Desulfofundulus thermobenzoicus]|uniref:Phosphonate ABC transporter substrate-binding protein n=1 Tax=Desulfofundulus thermobenzoicus TaxID=29376 RepID=A0A6N7IVD3_9FIRM|nr:phosphonate ABC transporter substrate-binding protein [Desulfofundulus thermobenzoicus]MQL53523.1 phosphonate ABC transporter substrate-binding protein [Desulfofundulus thermobenzoicus]